MNAGLVAKYVSYSLWRQLGDILPIALITVIAGGALYAINAFLGGIHFMLQFLLYAISYLAVTFVCRLRVRKDMVKIINVLRKNNDK